MSGQRVAILDASESLYHAEQLDSSAMDQSDSVIHIGLQPLPNFRETVLETVRQGLAEGIFSPRRVIPIGIGIICDTETVKELGKMLHDKVSASLKT